MAAGIITILAALIPAVVEMFLSGWRKKQTPEYAQAQRRLQAEQDLVRRDGMAASRAGIDDLAELERLQHRSGDPKR